MGLKRKTKSVKIILDAFGETNNALSVTEMIKRFENDMNKTTVYRILERLEEESLLHSFVGKDGLKWVAKPVNLKNNSNKNHPHFQCEDCGKSECLKFDFSIPKIPNVKINSSHLILVGQCEDCIS